jgi:hypothetical protein
MPASLQHFAVLAPIPLEHLESGRSIAEATGYVAFGTNKWELFQKIDTMREVARVAVLIYPSWGDESVDTGMRVSWFGWYNGHTHSKGGAHRTVVFLASADSDFMTGQSTAARLCTELAMVSSLTRESRVLTI